MNAKQLKALKGSIQKWHDIRYHDGTDLGMFNCPCCIAFGDDCNGCPVAEAVDDVLCESTPYIAWSNYEHDALDSDEAVQNKLAEDELHFLVCLLPKGETAKMTDGTTWYWDWE